MPTRKRLLFVLMSCLSVVLAAAAPPACAADAGSLLAKLLGGGGKAPANRQTFMVPMADGVKLATDVYLPEGKGPWPVLMTRTPYSRASGGGAATRAVAGGIVMVSQDMRGRFGSEGENLPFVGCGWDGLHDGADTVAWLLKQPWCNGKVGTVGGSACGITQNLMAGCAPAGLVGQYISVAAACQYTDAAYVGGALRKEQVENWTNLNMFAPEAMGLWRDHPYYDAFWARSDCRLKYAVMNVPAVHVGGWFDTFSQGTIDAFVGRQYGGAEGGKGRQKLVMGPWTHMARSGKQGELTFPGSGAPKAYREERWFQCLLKGEDNGVMKEPAVAYYVMGDTADPKAPGNQWRTAEAWPVPAAETAFYFEKGGRLAAARPSAAGEVVEEYTFDPADPCPTRGGRNLMIPAGPMDQRSVEGRPDVRCFTTEPLAEPLEVTGRIIAKVWVASSAVDTDLSVRLCDVYPDGRSVLMADGILRLRLRNSFARPEPLVPGQAVEVAVDCWSTSVVFNKGHRIRVAVTSSNYPRFDLNPGTGKPWTESPERVKQTNRLFCDAARPSRILLPVVKSL